MDYLNEFEENNISEKSAVLLTIFYILLLFNRIILDALQTFLDDCRIPSSEWVLAKNCQEFIDTIELMGIPEVISFDHDLADFEEDGTEKTGYDCLKWLINFAIENELVMPECLFHSRNTVGVDNMKCYLDNYYKMDRL